MLRQVWIAECDWCGKTEYAQHTNGRYEPEYVLPVGWAKGASKNFCVCPECLARRGIKMEVFSA